MRKLFGSFLPSYRILQEIVAFHPLQSLVITFSYCEYFRCLSEQEVFSSKVICDMFTIPYPIRR